MANGINAIDTVTQGALNFSAPEPVNEQIPQSVKEHERLLEEGARIVTGGQSLFVAPGMLKLFQEA